MLALGTDFPMSLSFAVSPCGHPGSKLPVAIQGASNVGTKQHLCKTNSCVYHLGAECASELLRRQQQENPVQRTIGSGIPNMLVDLPAFCDGPTFQGRHFAGASTTHS